MDEEIEINYTNKNLILERDFKNIYEINLIKTKEYDTNTEYLLIGYDEYN